MTFRALNDQEVKVMGYTIGQKIIKAHMLSGDMTPGSEIGLRPDPHSGRNRYNGIS